MCLGAHPPRPQGGRGFFDNRRGTDGAAFKGSVRTTCHKCASFGALMGAVRREKRFKDLKISENGGSNWWVAVKMAVGKSGAGTDTLHHSCLMRNCGGRHTREQTPTFT